MKSLYLIAILPPPDATLRIDQLRKECSEKYQVHKALRPPVHITLYKPVWLEQVQESELIRSMADIGRKHFSFVQEARDFSRFGKRVLYLSATVNPEIMALHRHITQTFLEKGFDKEAKSNDAYHPHFTLAFRDVTPEKFEAMWQEYQHRRFYEQFTVNNFSILKHDGTKWNVLEDLPLNGDIEH